MRSIAALNLVAATLVAACSSNAVSSSSSASSSNASSGSSASSGASSGGGGGGGSATASSSSTTGVTGSSSGAGGSTLSNGMLEAHNAARAAVMPAASPAIPPLVWSDTVAAAAQSWANNCMFEHNASGYGQNIFAGTGDYAPSDVVSSWVSEASSYDYATNTCSKTCGHYTQVVWRDTTALGCGMASCTANSPFGGSGAWQLWVCDYDPAGNIEGQSPY